jgi:thymidylate kinase
MLDRSATGENDLDLLIDQSCTAPFLAILSRLGFKEAKISPKKQIPGILDYYGYDATAETLVHVHAHFQLILGHDSTKNYHLPIERPYLESAVQAEGFKVPTPEFEFLVFVIRMVLKHSTWDVILARQGNLSGTERQELVYLLERADRSKLPYILEKHLPCISPEFFDTCLRAIQPNSPWGIRVQTGWQLQHRLRAYARISRVLDIFLKLWRRLLDAFQTRLFNNIPRQNLGCAGAFVAIVGGDGAGKSTVVDQLCTFLSKDFNIRRVHMGKPPWSATTIAVRGILKIGRSFGLYPFVRAPVRYKSDDKPPEFPGYPWLLREVCTARDRYRTYVKGRRFITKGGWVICDRYPLPQIKFMDGPLSDLMTRNVAPNFFLTLLTGLEKKYYQFITQPQLLIVLKIDPEFAVKRKWEVHEDEDSNRIRNQEIWDFDWAKTSAHVIDASQSKSEVLSRVKALLWSNL